MHANEQKNTAISIGYNFYLPYDIKRLCSYAAACTAAWASLDAVLRTRQTYRAAAARAQSTRPY